MMLLDSFLDAKRPSAVGDFISRSKERPRLRPFASSVGAISAGRSHLDEVTGLRSRGSAGPGAVPGPVSGTGHEAGRRRPQTSIEECPQRNPDKVSGPKRCGSRLTPVLANVRCLQGFRRLDRVGCLAAPNLFALDAFPAYRAGSRLGRCARSLPSSCGLVGSAGVDRRRAEATPLSSRSGNPPDNHRGPTRRSEDRRGTRRSASGDSRSARSCRRSFRRVSYTVKAVLHESERRCTEHLGHEGHASSALSPSSVALISAAGLDLDNIPRPQRPFIRRCQRADVPFLKPPAHEPERRSGSQLGAPPLIGPP